MVPKSPSDSPVTRDLVGIAPGVAAPPEDPRARLYRNLNRSKIPGMDGIRGYAALSVVGFHAISYHLPGDHAVRMFFVVSGLLITWLLLKENQKTGRIDLKAFYLRRGFRLLPPLAALIAFEVLTRPSPIENRAAAAAAFYFANYQAALGGSLGTFVHTWSLAIEEHFYLVWPAILSALVYSSRLIKGLLIAAGISAALQLALALSGAARYAATATEANAAAILTGCALAVAIWRNHQRIPRFLFAPMLAPAALAAVFILARMPRVSLVGWSLTASIPCMVVILLQAITYEWWILDNPVSRYLGQISYSVYLWQFVGIRTAHAISDRLRLPIGFRELTVLLSVIAIAAASNHWIERPAQRWLKKRLESKRVPAENPSPDYPLSTAT